MMNGSEILTKEEKEKISQECWEKALDKMNPM